MRYQHAAADRDIQIARSLSETGSTGGIGYVHSDGPVADEGLVADPPGHPSPLGPVA